MLRHRGRDDRLIALGSSGSGNFLFENYLITRAIPETVGCQASSPERRLAADDGRAGVEGPPVAGPRHRRADVHAPRTPGSSTRTSTFGNLLVRFDAEDRPHLAPDRPRRPRTTRRLGWRAAIRRTSPCLEPLFLALMHRAMSRSRFLPYLEPLRSRHRSAATRHAWFARSIEDSTRRWAERLWRRWGRRCCGKNKYFKTFRTITAWSIAPPRPSTAMTSPADPPGRPGSRPLEGAGSDRPAQGVADDDRRRG